MPASPDDEMVYLRLAYLREAADAVRCPTCGAERGEACLLGGRQALAFVGRDAWKREAYRQKRLQFVHLARHHAWVQVAVPTPAAPLA
jgi:hypothetical protein